MYYIEQTQEDIDFKGECIKVLYIELDEKGNSVRVVEFER